MLFNSFGFLLLFFPFTLCGFYSLAGLKNLRIVQAWLIVCSLFFHAYWRASYTWLFVVSMTINYFLGRICSLKPDNVRNGFNLPKLAVISGIVFNLGLLAYFKYLNFLANILSSTTGYFVDVGEIILPLAISFYTFQQIAYLADMYRDKGKVHYTLREYVSYLAFFPHLIAGPIVRHQVLIKQLNNLDLLSFRTKNVLSGLVIIFIGLFKKVILADSAAMYVNPIFATVAHGLPVGMIDAWLAAVLFSFVIYFDFSGYSDMAIGLARTFNVRFPENFCSPYKSASIIEFWQRWHITLSLFLRDYLYFSLGGNRKGKFRQSGNLLMTMLLGGLWHGAGWNFVIWGGLHGIYLIIAHAWRGWAGRKLFFGRGLAKTLTFLAVAIAWVFFRANTTSEAKLILIGMSGKNGLYSLVDLPSGYFDNGILSAIALCIVLLFIVNCLPNTQQFMRLFRPVIGSTSRNLSGVFNRLVWQFNFQTIALTILIACYVMTKLDNIQAFIYFRF